MTGPKPAWLFQHLRLLRSNPAVFFERLARDFGPRAGLKLGDRLFYLLNDPELIRDVLITQGPKFEKFPRIDRTQGLFGDGLLTSEEPLHMKQRRLMQPAFHRDRINAYAAVMTDCARRIALKWQDGEERDLALDMNHLALDIVSRALFDASTEEDAARIGHELEIVLLMLNKIVMPLGGLRLALPLPSSRRYFTALRRLDDVVYGLIRQKRGLLLQDLLSVGMDDQQLRDEVMTLFVAGHDTTANALAWTWYLLAQHPEAQARLIEEAQALPSDPTAEDYAKLPFTERVLAESMRLFPPVWILGRRALGPYSFGDFAAPAGSVLLVCMQVLHRHPDLWPDPDRFLPDRAPPVHKFAFLPFGAGSRLCIGERFAWMEGVLSIATIARRWRFELVPGHPVEPLGLLTLRPKHGLRMRLLSARSASRSGSCADHPAPM